MPSCPGNIRARRPAAATPDTTAGFTLLEVILVLVVVGIAAVVSVSAIQEVTRGFVFARANAEAVGKAQIALLRLIKEGLNISTVTSGTATSIDFTSLHGTPASPQPKSYQVSLNGSTLIMDDGSTQDILLDQVTSFTLSYYDSYNDSTPSSTWTTTSKIIAISLSVQAADNEQATFTARIRPRNIH